MTSMSANKISVHDSDCTDLIELSVGTENEGQDMKHFDPYHTTSLVPFRERGTRKITMQQTWGDTGIIACVSPT